MVWLELNSRPPASQPNAQPTEPPVKDMIRPFYYVSSVTGFQRAALKLSPKTKAIMYKSYKSWLQVTNVHLSFHGDMGKTFGLPVKVKKCSFGCLENPNSE